MAVKKTNVQFKVKIPLGLPSIVREEIGERIIQDIKKRTSKGLDKDNKPFPKYTKEYKESADFKAVGKTSRVNLKLSGDMLDSLDILSNKDGVLTIGYEIDDEVAGRVEGNVIGSYGQPTGSVSKARDFLGIKESKVELIVEEVKSELAPDIDKQSELLDVLAAELLTEIVGDEDG